MNPRAFLGFVLVVAVAVALIVWLAGWWISRSAGVRRKDFSLMREERDLAVKALHQIELKTDLYRDIDSVLATDVRTILRDHSTNRMELNR